ncbi:hypothetical protein LJB88_04430 [Erysipelotrichaceae bacterium OttesenSCG-928-M19]|nr:hypothetical protein [Erysipelotrichaceae bacterium OttesenSCG-928-M19]
MSSRANLDIEKLREDQIKKEALFKGNPELINLEIERKRKKREAAKQAIIQKINEDANKVKDITQTQPTQLKPIEQQPTPPSKPVLNEVKPEVLKAPEIKVIKTIDDSLPNNEKIQETQEKLSYTLQMDVISNSQVAAYKKRKQRKEGLNIERKFAKSSPQMLKIYLAVVIVLVFLIVLTMYFIEKMPQ